MIMKKKKCVNLTGSKTLKYVLRRKLPFRIGVFNSKKAKDRLGIIVMQSGDGPYVTRSEKSRLTKWWSKFGGKDVTVTTWDYNPDVQS
jgi:hypothetical protein